MAERIRLTDMLQRLIFVILVPLCLPLALPGQGSVAEQRSRIDQLTTDPETKFATLDAMASTLGTHRNRLILLRKESGRSFADIYADELRKRGASEPAIEARLRQVLSLVDGGSPRWRGTNGPRPIAYLGATLDRNSAGVFVTLAPEIGVDFGRFALVAGMPIYRISATRREATGIGDAYVSAFVRQPLQRMDLGLALTVGAPTGSKDNGLGAGRVSVDLNGTLQRQFESIRPFVTGGYTNSTFNNVGYQRPFISNGNAFYASGGLDYSIRRRWTAGAGGFALHAIGSQTVISQMVGMPEGSMPGMGHGSGPHGMPAGMSPGAPVYGRAPVASVPGQDISDHGATGWTSWSPRQELTFHLRIAHSFPYGLTTVRLGMGIDLSRPFARVLRR